MNAKSKSFPNLISEFLLDIDAGEAMRRTYENALKQYGKRLKTIKAKQYTQETILNFRNFLRDNGRRATTIQLYLVVLHRFFLWMYKKKYMSEFIADGVKMPKTGDTFIKAHLSADQAKRLLENIDTSTIIGKRDYAMIALMLTTGVRTIEVARANRSDLNTLSSPVLFIQGKGHDDKDAYVKIAPTIMDAINKYLASARMYSNHKALFISFSRRCEGKRLTTRSISRIVKNRLIEAGFDDRLLSAHSLRHTAATMNLLNGGSLEETQQLLRHKAITTTVRYTHALKRESNNSEERIAGAIFGGENF